MTRRLPRGLRTRLLLAMLLTSFVTVCVAATVLVSPFPDRLRQQSAVNLRAAVLASRPAIEKAVRRRLDDPFAMRSVSEELRQRTDGRVVVLGPTRSDDVIYDTSTDAGTAGATLVSLRT